MNFILNISKLSEEECDWKVFIFRLMSDWWSLDEVHQLQEEDLEVQLLQEEDLEHPEHLSQDRGADQVTSDN